MSSQKKGGWGSVFSGAISNLESRLDSILADEGEAAAAAQARAASNQSTGNRPRTNSGRLATPSSNASAAGSRDASRTRVNDRLAERLARATAQKPPSRVSTPVNDADSVRSSGELKREDEVPRSVPEIEIEKPEADDHKDSEEHQTNGDDAARPPAEEPGSLTTSALPINPARISIDSPRPSTEFTPDESSARPSLEYSNGTHTPSKSAVELQAEMEQMRSDYAKAETQRQEEMHAYMERIDALQAKLTYLAKETVAAAKEANAAAGASSTEKQVAEKDEKIALLMEEGEKLSKNDMQRMQTIKKLRAKASEDEKTSAELKRRLERVEKSEADLKAKVRRFEVSERQAAEKVKQIAAIEKQVEELRVDRENAAELVRSLTTQLKEAREKAAKAEKEAASKASEADKGKIADLQNELEDAQIEKKLAEDRAASEIKKAKEEADRQREKFGVRELEMKNEIHGLESRLEAMRARAEEVTSAGGSTDGESSVKLMRQVETLQQQYALAKSNWETIEGSLNARVAALEKERDDSSRREGEFRKKARDAGSKARKAEEELESTADRVRTLEQEIKSQQEQIESLRSRLNQSETALSDAKSDFDRQRKLWETESASRLEEEKLKWRKEHTHLAALQSPTASSRKASAADYITARGSKPLTRMTSHDLAALHTDHQRPHSSSRRGSHIPTPTSAASARGYPGPGTGTPTEASPSISRRESTLSFDPIPANNIPPTPSIEIDTRRLSEDSSPQRTIADLVSATSTAGPGGAGPSVQLVERMSQLVRKLESEKASFKDELQRLSQQRDEARNEVVELMREVEKKRTHEGKLEDVEKEMGTLKQRYEASLEMLGEREEEVEELKGDIVELKRIYKELVEAKVGGGGGSGGS